MVGLSAAISSGACSSRVVFAVVGQINKGTTEKTVDVTVDKTVGTCEVGGSKSCGWCVAYPFFPSCFFLAVVCDVVLIRFDVGTRHQFSVE